MEYEWIEWDGKGFPKMDPHKVIEVQFRDGTTDAMDAGVWHLQFDWKNDPDEQPHDIVAYRDTDWRPVYTSRG